MLGRALLRFPVRSRLLPSACQHDLALPAPVLLAVRAYATPGRPKSVVGEPSRPVKRAVKKAAREPANGESPAEKLVRAKRRSAAKKPKRNLTPEQKAAKKEKAKAATEKAKLKQLKETALNPPPNSQVNAYQLFIAEKMPEKLKQDGPQTGAPTAERRQATARAMRAVAADWKALSAAELEHFNHIAVKKREANAADYKAWVESRSPDDIHRANNARAQLRIKLEKDNKGKSSKWAKIVDERAVKRPLTAFAQFSANRHASGDFRNIALGERAKLIAQEWKSLNGDEKKKYQNLQEQERDRYATEFRDTYGYDAPAPKAVAAAA